MNWCRLTLTLMVLIGAAAIVSTGLTPLIPLAALVMLLLMTKPSHCEYITLALATLTPLIPLASQDILPLALVMIEEVIYASLLITRLSKLGKLIMAINLPLSIILFILYYVFSAWRPIVNYIVYLVPLTSNEIVSMALINSMMFTVVTLLAVNYLLLRLMSKGRS